jgi:hypothetical protein
VAAALLQLEAAGKSLRPGQNVRILYTLGRPGVRAWDLPERLTRMVVLHATRPCCRRAGGDGGVQPCTISSHPRLRPDKNDPLLSKILRDSIGPE